MVEYNELTILPCGQGISLDVSVKNLAYYTDVYIDRIIIDTQETYTPEGPNSNPVYTYTVEGNLKEVQLTIDFCDFTEPPADGTLFFVYVITKGTPSTDTPCGMDKDTSVKAIIDENIIYEAGLKYIKETYAECTVPKDFIDFILRFRAFMMCLKTENYPMAITYWKRFFRSLKKPTSNCGCYGRDTI